ncbi:MAG TPA: sugar isomerase, partial [Puia sp.]
MDRFVENSDKILGYFLSNLAKQGGLQTAREIIQQPALWLSTWRLLLEKKDELGSFLQEAGRDGSPDIILTGAGTSAFIGNILQGPFMKHTGNQTRAVASTDLITHPRNYFKKQGTTLLISFARSGDSPESVAASELAEICCDKVYHLIITCNPSGKLAKGNRKFPTCVFLLPPESDDQSLVMTGSFSAMLLAGLLISRIGELEQLEDEMQRLSAYGSRVIEQYSDKLKEIAGMDFKRAVFLGSGPLQGAARESHLKIQELSGGKIICKCDSFLGFRHGPKAVINSSTLLIYLFSSDPFVHQYETDFVKSVNHGEKGLCQIGIFESGENNLGLDEVIAFSEDREKLDEDFLS